MYGVRHSISTRTQEQLGGKACVRPALGGLRRKRDSRPKSGPMFLICTSDAPGTCQRLVTVLTASIKIIIIYFIWVVGVMFQLELISLIITCVGNLVICDMILYTSWPYPSGLDIYLKSYSIISTSDCF